MTKRIYLNKVAEVLAVLPIATQLMIFNQLREREERRGHNVRKLNEIITHLQQSNN